jgi:Voltage gated chloride channel
VADAGGGSSNSSSGPDDDDDDDDDRRIRAAELGLAGSVHDDHNNNNTKMPKVRKSVRKPPLRDAPSKVVRYGAAHDDENQKNLPAPPTGGEVAFRDLASSAPSSYQWTISPRDENSQFNLDQLSASQQSPLRLSIGEEYVPLRPPAAHRSSAPPPQGPGSDGSGVEASSSQDDAWSSVSELYSHRTSEGVTSDNPNQSLFRFDGSEQPSATGCFGGGGIARWIARWLDPTPWLTRDVKYRAESGAPYFETRSCWTAAGWARHFLWNPIQPEFTSLQLFCWAVVIGVVMGFYTAAWKALIETCIDLLWVTVPTRLLQWGFFTSVDGSFPLYHYMWMCPSVLGGIVSWAITVLPDKIPDQNDWIRNVHTRGTQDHASFLSLFVVATAGMASGLSLGPELPLVLTAGMAGSWLGLVCKQSVLQARVMNLTAASAAVGGFFGFPMAGALFVLGTCSLCCFLFGLSAMD